MILETGGNGSWDVIENLLKDISIPRFVKVRQKFVHPEPVDVAREISSQLNGSPLWDALKPGQTVAITVGSRGIANMVTAVRTIGDLIKSHGGKPFMIPAMGSHAGATAQGQTNMLLGLGFTKEATGMDIHATMDTVEVCRTAEENLPVFIDRNAWMADHVVVINRIKPHVCFRGDWESGLMKMITIGMGKQKGAEVAHNLGFGHMPEHIRQIATHALKHLKVLFAVGLVENAFHETCIAKVMSGSELPETERRLLIRAKEIAPRLFFDDIDAIVIDEIGKNISGSGFDTNVIGRYHSEWLSGGPRIRRVLILDIADKSNGNGNGLGMADFTTFRAARKFDFTETYPNTLTALLTGGVKIPMVLPNDRLGIQACMKTSYLSNWEDTRFVRIHNTLCLDEIEVSENLAKEIAGDDRFEILTEPYELVFDKDGNLF